MVDAMLWFVNEKSCRVRFRDCIFRQFESAALKLSNFWLFFLALICSKSYSKIDFASLQREDIGRLAIVRVGHFESWSSFGYIFLS
jgi:hypothetical protein